MGQLELDGSELPGELPGGVVDEVFRKAGDVKAGEGVEFELTERDVATIRWAGEWSGVLVKHVHRWWGLPGNRGLHGAGGVPSEQKVRGRLGRLARAGVFSVHGVPASKAKVYSVTSAGLSVVGRGSWPQPRWRWGQFHHEHTATRVALRLLESGFDVMPERRMRHDDRAGVSSWKMVMPSNGEKPAFHYPDLWVRDPGGVWQAIEVELSVKDLPRLRAILEAYRERGAKVTYYTNDLVIEDAVLRAAREVVREDWVRVERVPLVVRAGGKVRA